MGFAAAALHWLLVLEEGVPMVGGLEALHPVDRGAVLQQLQGVALVACLWEVLPVEGLRVGVL